MNTNALFSFESLLDRIVEAVQLTPTLHERAVSSYGHVTSWLSAPGCSTASCDPHLFPQGSMLLRTTVRPSGQVEFDLDVVCLLRRVDPRNTTASMAYDLVASRLAEHEAFRTRMTRPPRCIRLQYAGEFHLDVVPACMDPHQGGTLLVARDPRSPAPSAWESWKPTDPQGFAHWFYGRCAEGIRFRALAKVDPVPAFETAEQKSPLQKMVQLLKHRRNLFYEVNSPPSSILLTTMLGSAYSGEAFTLPALTDIVSQVASCVVAAGEQLIVSNPTLPSEDLAAPLGTEGKHKLGNFLRRYHEELVSLQGRRGPEAAEALSAMYDRAVTERVIRAEGEAAASAKATARLRTSGESGRLVTLLPGAAALAADKPNPPHTFYGGIRGGTA